MATPTPSDVTRLLERAGDGDAGASDELLPLVYEQLRGLAEAQMAREPAGHTLQPTALVHEAYLRLVGDEDHRWSSRGHFYGAAAHAMRRILVERSRRYRRIRHGGGRPRVPLDEAQGVIDADRTDLLALDDALTQLQQQDARLGDIVVYRYFGGLTNEQTADLLGISARTVRREWSYARLWLYKQVSGCEAPGQRKGEADER